MAEWLKKLEHVRLAKYVSGNKNYMLSASINKTTLFSDHVENNS